MTVSPFTLDFGEGAYVDVVRVSSNDDGAMKTFFTASALVFALAK
jgi:hypothetical protein